MDLLYYKLTKTVKTDDGKYANTDNKIMAFTVPTKLCPEAIQSCHKDMCHQGCDDTYSLLRERFWWSCMLIPSKIVTAV